MLGLNLGLSLASAASNAPGPNAVLAALGPSAEWRFDTGAGQSLVDRTANGHHGRLGSTTGAEASDPTWTAQGLSFDGIDDWVEHDTAGISGGAARTVLAVVKPGAASSLGIEWTGTGPNFQRWTLRDDGAAKIRLEVGGGGYTTALAVPASTWMFVGATQAGSNLNSCILYLNGSSEASTTSATLNTQGNFTWGRKAAATTPMAAAYGLVFSRALSPAEVAQARAALTTILAARGITLP